MTKQQEPDNYQIIGANTIGFASMMMIDAWKEDDPVKGRRAAIIVRTVESMNIDQLEVDGILLGMLVSGVNVPNLDKEEKASFLKFTNSCYNQAKAIRNSIRVPDIAFKQEIKDKLMAAMLDQIAKRDKDKANDAPTGDTDSSSV